MIDATQRKLIVGVVIVTLMTWTIVIVDLARGGRPDPPELRAAATLLDGTWAFHTGDDPRWADAKTDDSGWEALDMTAPPGSHDGDVGLPDYVRGWAAQGHPAYAGFAWYRRAVTVPAGHASWDILGPTLVEDGYEIYWNGRLLGGSGRLGADPRFVGTRPLRFALPMDAAGARGVVAIRVFMRRRAAPSADGGGIRSPPILAPRPVSDALHRVQWERTIAGYVVDAIEPLAMFALIGLVLWCWPRSSHKGFLIFASIALALTGARRLNNAITAWTDLQDLTTYAFLAKVMWIPTVAAWILAWNRWSGRPWRSVDVLAVVLAVVTTVSVMRPWPSVTTGSRFGSLALLVAIGVRIVRTGPMRSLALVTLALIIAAFFGGELLDPIGVPGIWFPFGIGVSRTQYIYAMAIPLLAVLIARTTGKVVERKGKDPRRRLRAGNRGVGGRVLAFSTVACHFIPITMRFGLFVAAVSLPLALTAQQSSSGTAAQPNGVARTFLSFGQPYGGWLLLAFDSIPASQYGFRPTPVQQSIGFIAQHLETANYGLCSTLGAQQHVPSAMDLLPDTVKARWPKDTLIARVRSSLEFCATAIRSLSDAQLADAMTVNTPAGPQTVLRARYLILLVTDLAEHYAQIAGYMRLLGLVPPSALPRPQR